MALSDTMLAKTSKWKSHRTLSYQRSNVIDNYKQIYEAENCQHRFHVNARHTRDFMTDNCKLLRGILVRTYNGSKDFFRGKFMPKYNLPE